MATKRRYRWFFNATREEWELQKTVDDGKFVRETIAGRIIIGRDHDYMPVVNGAYKPKVYDLDEAMAYVEAEVE